MQNVLCVGTVVDELNKLLLKGEITRTTELHYLDPDGREEVIYENEFVIESEKVIVTGKPRYIRIIFAIQQ